MGSRYFEVSNCLELSSSCVTQKFNNILSGPLKGTWPHEILFYFTTMMQNNYLMDHRTTNLYFCQWTLNLFLELGIFRWASIAGVCRWSRLDWIARVRRRRQSAIFDCDLNHWKTRSFFCHLKRVNFWIGRMLSMFKHQINSRIKSNKNWKNKKSVSKLSCQWPS